VFDVKGLEGGHIYTVKVFAWNSKARSEQSATFSVHTKLGATPQQILTRETSKNTLSFFNI
jgi:hypothetical protein